LVAMISSSVKIRLKDTEPRPYLIIAYGWLDTITKIQQR
jgi:hypothetical protein